MCPGAILGTRYHSAWLLICVLKNTEAIVSHAWLSYTIVCSCTLCFTFSQSTFSGLWSWIKTGFTPTWDHYTCPRIIYLSVVIVYLRSEHELLFFYEPLPWWWWRGMRKLGRPDLMMDYLFNLNYFRFHRETNQCTPTTFGHTIPYISSYLNLRITVNYKRRLI